MATWNLPRAVCGAIIVTGCLLGAGTGDAAANCWPPAATLLEQLRCASEAAGSADRWPALVDRLRRDATIVPQNNFHSRRMIEGGEPAGGRATPMPAPPQPSPLPSPRQVLAPANQEVFAARIGWHVNESVTALGKAFNANKLTVLVIGETGCRWCAWLVREVLPCAAINRFAGRAVFAYSEPSQDPAARAVGEVMKIKRYPVTVFIEPDAGKLNVPAHIGGFFNAHRFSKIMEKYFERTQAWQRPAPSIAQANRLRAENGLTQGDPKPRACEAMPIWMK